MTTRVVLFYAIMAAAGIGWAAYDNRNAFLNPGSNQASEAASVALGAGLGILVVGLSRLAEHHFAWARALDAELRKNLGYLSGSDVLIFAVSSGVAEEIFFRGAMQPSIGLVATSILFGILHIGPNRKFIPWPIFAAILGLASGTLFIVTGNLLAPIIAHFTINFFNLNNMRISKGTVPGIGD